MDFSPFSLLVVKVFSLITGGLGAEACAQILKVPLEELEPIIADLKEGGQLQSDPDRPARIMITSRGRCGIADAERMAGGVRRDR